MLEAVELSKPIIALKIENSHGAYDFADAVKLLSDLETELPRRGCQAALHELKKLDIDLAEASRKLSATIPQCMSTPYNQAWGEKLRRGALSDLLDRVKAMETSI